MEVERPTNPHADAINLGQVSSIVGKRTRDQGNAGLQSPKRPRTGMPTSVADTESAFRSHCPALSPHAAPSATGSIAAIPAGVDSSPCSVSTWSLLSSCQRAIVPREGDRLSDANNATQRVSTNEILRIDPHASVHHRLRAFERSAAGFDRDGRSKVVSSSNTNMHGEASGTAEYHTRATGPQRISSRYVGPMHRSSSDIALHRIGTGSNDAAAQYASDRHAFIRATGVFNPVHSRSLLGDSSHVTDADITDARSDTRRHLLRLVWHEKRSRRFNSRSSSKQRARLSSQWARHAGVSSPPLVALPPGRITGHPVRLSERNNPSPETPGTQMRNPGGCQWGRSGTPSTSAAQGEDSHFDRIGGDVTPVVAPKPSRAADRGALSMAAVRPPGLLGSRLAREHVEGSRFPRWSFEATQARRVSSSSPSSSLSEVGPGPGLGPGPGRASRGGHPHAWASGFNGASIGELGLGVGVGVGVGTSRGAFLSAGGPGSAWCSVSNRRQRVPLPRRPRLEGLGRDEAKALDGETGALEGQSSMWQSGGARSDSQAATSEAGSVASEPAWFAPGGGYGYGYIQRAEAEPPSWGGEGEGDGGARARTGSLWASHHLGDEPYLQDTTGDSAMHAGRPGAPAALVLEGSDYDENEDDDDDGSEDEDENEDSDVDVPPAGIPFRRADNGIDMRSSREQWAREQWVSVSPEPRSETRFAKQGATVQGTTVGYAARVLGSWGDQIQRNNTGNGNVEPMSGPSASMGVQAMECSPDKGASDSGALHSGAASMRMKQNKLADTKARDFAARASPIAGMTMHMEAETGVVQGSRMEMDRSTASQAVEGQSTDDTYGNDDDDKDEDEDEDEDHGQAGGIGGEDLDQVGELDRGLGFGRRSGGRTGIGAGVGVPFRPLPPSFIAKSVGARRGEFKAEEGVSIPRVSVPVVDNTSSPWNGEQSLTAATTLRHHAARLPLGSNLSPQSWRRLGASSPPAIKSPSMVRGTERRPRSSSVSAVSHGHGHGNGTPQWGGGERDNSLQHTAQLAQGWGRSGQVLPVAAAAAGILAQARGSSRLDHPSQLFNRSLASPGLASLASPGGWRGMSPRQSPTAMDAGQVKDGLTPGPQHGRRFDGGAACVPRSGSSATSASASSFSFSSSSRVPTQRQDPRAGSGFSSVPGASLLRLGQQGQGQVQAPGPSQKVWTASSEPGCGLMVTPEGASGTAAASRGRSGATSMRMSSLQRLQARPMASAVGEHAAKEHRAENHSRMSSSSVASLTRGVWGVGGANGNGVGEGSGEGRGEGRGEGGGGGGSGGGMSSGSSGPWSKGKGALLGTLNGGSMRAGASGGARGLGTSGACIDVVVSRDTSSVSSVSMSPLWRGIQAMSLQEREQDDQREQSRDRERGIDGIDGQVDRLRRQEAELESARSSAMMSGSPLELVRGTSSIDGMQRAVRVRGHRYRDASASSTGGGEEAAVQRPVPARASGVLLSLPTRGPPAQTKPLSSRMVRQSCLRWCTT